MTTNTNSHIYQGEKTWVECDNSQQIILLHCHAYTDMTEYKTALLESLNYAHNHHIKKYIFDHRQLQLLAEGHLWFEQKWLPEALKKLGNISMAFLVSQKTNGETALKKTMPNRFPPNSFQVGFFQQENAAHKWLQEH
ncbi:MAG: hypothetical protein EAZ55_03700 [Cytophagales bacterium]|nr:MAG: hypothetical protein EAZ55_03700 [Cytophagales bacterium]